MVTKHADQLFPTAGDAYRYCQKHGLEISMANDKLWDIAEALYDAEHKTPESDTDIPYDDVQAMLMHLAEAVHRMATDRRAMPAEEVKLIVEDCMEGYRRPSAKLGSIAPEKLAANIADNLFELGDEPGRPTYRIQFMGGDTLSEYAQGGLDKPALTRFLAQRLKNALDEV